MQFRYALLLALIAAFALVACGEKEGGSLEDGLKDVAESVEDMSSTVANFSKDKIEAIAAIAAKLESAPEEAKKMLDERGWTREEFDKMLAQVKNNEATRKIFEAAQKMTGSH